MNKKLLILLADTIKDHNQSSMTESFTKDQIVTLARFCAKANPNFNRDRWMDYIESKCGLCGSKVNS